MKENNTEQPTPLLQHQESVLDTYLTESFQDDYGSLEEMLLLDDLFAAAYTTNEGEIVQPNLEVVATNEQQTQTVYQDEDDFSEYEEGFSQVESIALVNDYKFVFVQFNNEAKKLKRNIFLRELASDNLPIAILCQNQHKLALTYSHVRLLDRQTPKKFLVELLQEDNPTTEKCFSHLKPFVTQDYEDSVLFVDKRTMLRQLSLATRDIGVFSDPSSYILQTIFLNHDGAILVLEPFSAPIGAFRISTEKENNSQQLIQKIVFDLTSVFSQNREHIVQTLRKFILASDNEIHKLMISVQIGFYQSPKCKEKRFYFGKLKSIEQEQKILSINLNELLEGAPQTDCLTAALNDFFDNLNSNHLSKRKYTREDLLCVFKITFLKNNKQLLRLVKKRNITYIKNTFFQENHSLKSIIGSEAVVQNLPLPLAFEVDKNYQNSMESIDWFKSHIFGCFELLQIGILLEKVSKITELFVLGTQYKLNDIIKERNHFLGTVHHETHVSALLQNPFLTHLVPTFITADEESLLFQMERLERNLSDLIQGKELKTEFVFLDGFLSNIEAFDILIGVVYDAFDEAVIEQDIRQSAYSAIQLVTENGFLQRLATSLNLPETQVKLFYSFKEFIPKDELLQKKRRKEFRAYFFFI